MTVVPWAKKIASEIDIPDFSIALNGEDLIYDKKKLYFPAKELSDNERQAINQKVYQAGNEYSIKNSKVNLNEYEVSD